MKYKISQLTIFIISVLTINIVNCTVPKGESSTSENIISSYDPLSIGKIVNELDSKITVIFQDKNGNYWFGGGESGAFKYQPELPENSQQKLIKYTLEDGLCSTSVLGIQEDKYGNIYFDTTEGVCKFDHKKFTTLKVAKTSPLSNEWKLEEDDLWFRMGWNHSGPFRYDGENLIALEFPKTEEADKFFRKFPNASFNPYGVYRHYKDKKGRVWFGTSSLGAYMFNGKSGGWIYEDQMTITSEGGALGIRSVLEDDNGYFWFTNTRYYYDILPQIIDKKGTDYLSYQKKDGVGSITQEGMEYPYFMDITQDNEGVFWMVTYENGVWKNDGKKLTHFPIKDGSNQVLLFSIYKDNKGNIWLGSHNAGPFRFNGTTFKKFDPLTDS